MSRYIEDYTETHIPSPYGPLDAEGIPLWDPRSFRLKGEPLYHPIVIIQYGLANHDRAMHGKGDREAEARFFECAQWTEEHAVDDPLGRFVTWPYSFPLRTPPVKPPWVSGMAQGQALSLLARLFVKTHSPRTADVARQAARSFCYSIPEGGVVSELRSGAFFIEEVAHEPAIQVLNGCLYGLFGLYEHLQVFDDPELQPVLEKCVAGVDELLPLFDMGWWSRYSLGVRWHMAPPYYHNVHIHQLRRLSMLLNRPRYSRYAERWEGYQQSAPSRLQGRMLGVLEVNVNRALTIVGLNGIKYRRTGALNSPSDDGVTPA